MARKELLFLRTPASVPDLSTGSPDAELDICCVVDGEFILGEVKESSRDINDKLGDDLIAIVNEIRPDKVVIACLDRSARIKLDAQAHRIKEGLRERGCVIEAIVPDSLFGRGERLLRYIVCSLIRSAFIGSAKLPAAPLSSDECQAVERC